MALIFVGSTSSLSGENTSRFLEPLLRWLFPEISASTLEQLQLLIRKIGHFCEYALLAALCWIAIHRPTLRQPRPWSWAQASGAFLLAVCYAITDEIHQSTVPSRHASAWDVLVDAGGAAVGLLLIWLWHLWRSRSSL